MSVRIRLARNGSKKRPVYAIVVATSDAPRDGRFIEKIGTLNPLAPKGDAGRLLIDVERARHWLRKGAVPSERAAACLEDAGIRKASLRFNPEKARPKQKMAERAARDAAPVEAAKASDGVTAASEESTSLAG